MKFVYFVQLGEDGPVKIGSAVDIAKRMDQLQNGNAAPLYLRAVAPGGHAAERDFHKQFARDRLRGEWFQPSPALLEAMDAVPKTEAAAVPVRKRRDRMAHVEAEAIWRDVSLTLEQAIDRMVGWTPQFARDTFGFRTIGPDGMPKRGHSSRKAREYGLKGGKVMRDRSIAARWLSPKMTKEREAVERIWRDPIHQNAEAALAALPDELGTISMAYRVLGKRRPNMVTGRPRSAKRN